MTLETYIELANAAFITMLILMFVGWSIAFVITFRAKRHKNTSVFVRTGMTDSVEIKGYSPRETIRLVSRITSDPAAVAQVKKDLGQ